MRELSSFQCDDVSGGALQLAPIIKACGAGAATAALSAIAQSNNLQQGALSTALGCISGAHGAVASMTQAATRVIHATYSGAAAFAGGVAGMSSPTAFDDKKLIIQGPMSGS